ncbi:WD40 repeat domain-containing protein [Plantactinospora sp. CA-294935]|uniref:WD40 repeat domain-containing protein n=1 Tax=Plantactinospora sp. CA-294935 TaxID=3240012 RepID=UPI003D927151
MSEHADRLLREAVRELAGTPHQPPDFAATAIVQGRRMRRRRQTIAAAAAFVAIGAIAAPYVWLRPDPQPPALGIGGPPAATTPASSPTPRSAPSGGWPNGPVELPGGALLLSAGSTRQAGPTWAYDSVRRRYVSVPASYTSVRVAPHRPIAAVRSSDRPTEVGLYDLATGKPQWFRTGRTVMGVEWSPDGRRLLATLQDRKAGTYTIGLLTPDAGAFRYYPVKTRPVSCLGFCRFTWAPGGREVALSQAEAVVGSPKVPPPTGPGLQLFAADDGMPTRFLPVRGGVASSAAWSPDGSLVVVSTSSAAAVRDDPEPPAKGKLTAQLVSTQTGKVVRQLPSADVTWVTSSRLLYLDPARPGGLTVVLVDPTGAEHERAELPLELASSDDITFAAR